MTGFEPWMIEPWHTEPFPLDGLFGIEFLPESTQIDACETVRKIIAETNRNVFRIYERRIERMKYELFKELERKIYERSIHQNIR